ncbi:hypothetical protein [Flavobacterium sp. N502540]|uniref:hypothetical protein n=1 Tax=Flavobacterium sp. N502540 TaxID=2986838 RepID=UPI002225550B|nr:hypothetical protein [Flavobacterium sp. N502540]
MKKKILLSIFLQLALLGCKSNNEENVSKENLKNTVVQNQSNTANKESFTIDCGSGCAMIYDEISRKINTNSVEIKFEITQYIDEKIEGEYFETYLFESDQNKNLSSIHLNKNQGNILNDNNSLLREKLLEIGLKVYPKSVAKQANSEEIAFVADDEPYQLMNVPFDLKEYINNLPNPIENSYHPTAVTEEYLVSIGYEGEKYKCFFIKNDIHSTTLIVSVSRADSECFLLLKANQNGFLSYKEIGRIGGEETKYFKIDKNYNIVSY